MLPIDKHVERLQVQRFFSYRLESQIFRSHSIFYFCYNGHKNKKGKIWIFYLGFLPFWYHIRPFDIKVRPLLNLGLIVSNFDRSEILASTWYYYNLLYFTIWSGHPENSQTAKDFLTHVKSETWPAPLILQFRKFLYGEISQ